MPAASRSSRPWFRVRRSPIQGRGAFAIRRIPKGTRIIEYAGERITSEEAARRYTKDDPRIPILLFDLDAKTVIDAGHRGNQARFINHSCKPNCETVEDDRRIYIEAIRTIDPGTEITYDYHLEVPRAERARLKKIYVCRCGTKSCRGTMIEPLRRRRRSPATGKASKRRGRLTSSSRKKR
jgi:SET domain-containing protein